MQAVVRPTCNHNTSLHLAANVIIASNECSKIYEYLDNLKSHPIHFHLRINTVWTAPFFVSQKVLNFNRIYDQFYSFNLPFERHESLFHCSAIVINDIDVICKTMEHVRLVDYATVSLHTSSLNRIFQNYVEYQIREHVVLL